MSFSRIFLFGNEDDPKSLILRQKLDFFYLETKEYCAFHEASSKPEFWQPIKAAIEEIIDQTGSCRILEFGAGRTVFGEYLNELRAGVVFDVQDVTPSNKQH